MPQDEVTATLTVRPESGASERPTPARVQEAADCLRGQGFNVLHVGRFGVSVRGRLPLFERELGVRLVPAQTLLAPIRAREPRLALLLDCIEFAPPAEQFSGPE